MGLADGALDAGLATVGDFLGHQGGEEVAVRQAFGLRLDAELGIEPADGRQVEPAQEAVEVEGQVTPSP